MTINDGGPAFPMPGYIADANHPHFKWPTPGMSLRDFFAASALQGILSAPADVVSQDLGPFARRNSDLAAHTAYAMADAMIAERTKVRS